MKIQIRARKTQLSCEFWTFCAVLNRNGERSFVLFRITITRMKCYQMTKISDVDFSKTKCPHKSSLRQTKAESTHWLPWEESRYPCRESNQNRNRLDFWTNALRLLVHQTSQLILKFTVERNNNSKCLLFSSTLSVKFLRNFVCSWTR